MCSDFYSYFHLGSISQTLTYPFDVLRRKMQVSGMRDSTIKYNGAVHALTSIIRSEGVAGLYRGLWPNLRKFLFLFPVCAELIIGGRMQSRWPRV
jgi:hypothetical protein